MPLKSLATTVRGIDLDLNQKCGECAIIYRIFAVNRIYIYRMHNHLPRYIYQSPTWPRFTWRQQDLQVLHGEVRFLQGKILAWIETLGFDEQAENALSQLSLELVKSSEIEGEIIQYQQVRSSIARKLGINTAGLVKSPPSVDGFVEMLLDATHNHQNPITHDRLHSWHAALFPTGYSGLYKIEVGKYRTEEMEVVSGPIGAEKVHYRAPGPTKLGEEMEQLLDWIENEKTVDAVFKAAIAHFWFIILHPYDDGNGRIARAISDLLLARSEGRAERFYSLSQQMMMDRKGYYQVLQHVQLSDGDITEWLDWFLNCLRLALAEACHNMTKTLSKTRFWKNHPDLEINERQRKMINKLLDGFDGKLKSSKWAKICHCSTDTALRDIKDLIGKGILVQDDSGGRSVSYSLSEQ